MKHDRDIASKVRRKEITFWQTEAEFGDGFLALERRETDPHVALEAESRVFRVQITPTEHQRIEMIADAYGVSTATIAGMLLAHGVQGFPGTFESAEAA